MSNLDRAFVSAVVVWLMFALASYFTHTRWDLFPWFLAFWIFENLGFGEIRG